ncbi:hypothetical protein MPER_16181 [Moniliophthora perniciosa FA553]|nr:hypothetical protein MPER_16181 [Moniliophthora perniciosa FA553]
MDNQFSHGQTSRFVIALENLGDESEDVIQPALRTIVPIEQLSTVFTNDERETSDPVLRACIHLVIQFECGGQNYVVYLKNIAIIGLCQTLEQDWREKFEKAITKAI